MKIYTIYKVVNITNQKVYIGFDSSWPKRMNHHKSKFKKINLKFYDAIKKYGWNNFNWEILYQSKDGDYTLKTMESYFIKEYNSMEKGYNMTLGGEGSLGYKHTPEEKLKNSLRNSGINHVNYGKHLSVETKKKISEKNSGTENGMFGKTYIMAKEQKQKISDSMKGEPKSQEHRESIKKSKLDSNYIMTIETRKKMSEKKFKPVILNGLNFKSVNEAAKYYDVHYTTITRWVKNASV